MRLLAAVAGLILSASSVCAATVNNLGGQVLVNRGGGFRPVLGASEAGPGAQVVANPGGLGNVTYPDGCTVTVNPGEVYTIAPASPCATGNTGINGYAVGALVVGGAIAGIVISQQKSASP